MKIKPNIGIINALIRITLGFTFLAWATAKLTKRPRQNSTLLVAMMAGMKIAEGIVRYCPLTALLDRAGDNDHSRHQNEGIHKEQGMDAKSLMTEFAKMGNPAGALKSGSANGGKKKGTAAGKGMDAKGLMAELANMENPASTLKSGPTNGGEDKGTSAAKGMDAKGLMAELGKMSEPAGASKSGPSHTNGHQTTNTTAAHTNGQGKGTPTAAEEAIISQLENAIEQEGGNVKFDQILPNNPL